jgi:hypothetical protein
MTLNDSIRRALVDAIGQDRAKVERDNGRGATWYDGLSVPGVLAIDLPQNCTGDVTFANCVFSDRLVFSGNELAGQLRFVRCTFVGDVILSELCFKSAVGFSKCLFNNNGALVPATLDATGCVFEKEFEFDPSHTAHTLNFERAQFRDGLRFAPGNFLARVNFSRAEFFANSFMQSCWFSGGLSLAQSTLHSNAVLDLQSSKFETIMTAQGAKINGALSILAAHFSGEANFSLMHGEGILNLAGSVFSDVVLDIGGVSMVVPPSLERIAVPTAGELIEPPPNIVSRYRCLRLHSQRIGDHEAELAYFASQMRAARKFETSRWRLAEFVDACYDVFSDYGRSYVRPLMLWSAAMLVCWAVYIVASHPFAGRKVPIGSYVASVLGGDIRCGRGELVRLVSGHLAVKNGLLFIGWENSDRAKQSHACLFGMTVLEYPAQGSETAIRSAEPFIPIIVQLLALLQTIVSAVAIFLFFLALRNHFRIT